MPREDMSVLRRVETIKVIEKIGLSLFGQRWQSDMARCLGVNDRTVRRWVSGEIAPSEDVFKKLESLCRKRSDVAYHAMELAKAFRKNTGFRISQWEPESYYKKYGDPVKFDWDRALRPFMGDKN